MNFEELLGQILGIQPERKVSKTELAGFVADGLGHESFDHETQGTFDITLMRYASPEIAQLLCIDLASVCEHIRTSRIVEEERINDLPDHSWKHDPGLLLLMPDGTHMIIDGSHRALRRQKEGLTNMQFWVWPLEYAIRPGDDWVKPTGLDWGAPVESLRKPGGENV